MKRAICLLACCFVVLATPAFAEKVTLACSLGAGRVTFYYTIDSDAKTVTETDGTYPAQITDDAVTWTATNEPYTTGSMAAWRNMPSTYNRNTAQYWGWTSAFKYWVPCVKAPARPF